MGGYHSMLYSPVDVSNLGCNPTLKKKILNKNKKNGQLLGTSLTVKLS